MCGCVCKFASAFVPARPSRTFAGATIRHARVGFGVVSMEVDISFSKPNLDSSGAGEAGRRKFQMVILICHFFSLSLSCPFSLFSSLSLSLSHSLLYLFPFLFAFIFCLFIFLILFHFLFLSLIIFLLSFFAECLSVEGKTHCSLCVSCLICLAIYLSIHLSICLSISLSIDLSTPIDVSACQLVLSFHMSINVR